MYRHRHCDSIQFVTSDYDEFRRIRDSENRETFCIVAVIIGVVILICWLRE